jgi:hypothetical protein
LISVAQNKESDMNKYYKSDDHVLPRPVESLPDYAKAPARQNLAARLTEVFHLSQDAATAISNAVVDPTSVRKKIGDSAEHPNVEEISVPGGTLLGVRTTVWARRVIPDPRNPRILPSRRHPFAIEPGSGDENSRFRPIPEPRAVDEEHPERAELVVDIDSREHLDWASQQAATFILHDNDWRQSIASQGVMEAVWLVTTTYKPADGSEPAIVLTTAEGSSRITADHDLLEVRSADVPYDNNEGKLRSHLKKLNEAYSRGQLDNGKTVVWLRCERVPALILVGFRPHAKTNTGFSTAIKSLVALRHVDPPKPWGEGPENESLADEVLDELYRRGLISNTQRAYFGGSCTRAEASAANLAGDPAVRAAQIVQLLSDRDGRVSEAVRVAVTSQSTRKRLSTKLYKALASALIMRSVEGDRDTIDRTRRYMQTAFGQSVHKESWEATYRDADSLSKDALAEIRQWITVGMLGEPGPASLELAVRTAYPLGASRRLAADLGTLGKEQPDRRIPGEVLDAMRRSIQGVYQLGQALKDFAEDRPIRAVDEDGVLLRDDGGSEEKLINDAYLRAAFPAPGKVPSTLSDDKPLDRYNKRLHVLSKAVDTLAQAFDDLASVIGENGRALVESRGVDPQSCAAWRDTLRRIDEDLVLWSSSFRKAFGTGAAYPTRQPIRPMEDAGDLVIKDDDEIDADESCEREEVEAEELTS